jgi:Spy/CpxP family protein refolding chaperone
MERAAVQTGDGAGDRTHGSETRPAARRRGTTRALGIVLAVAATTAFAAAASAGPHGGRGGCDFRGGPGFGLSRLERGVEQLDLAPDTKQAVYKVIDQARTQQRALADQIRAAHQQMRTLLDAPTPDVDAVLAQADTLGGLMTQERKNDLRALVQIRTMLTPEQWQQLEPHGRRGGPGGPPPGPDAML